jgi:DNA-binding transcriptional LysR family regulator
MPANTRFDLIDLRLFLHVTDTGSITAGSKLSHLALASASARIRGMEDALGVPLLERLRSGVKPTKAGLAVIHHARLVLQQLERMRTRSTTTPAAWRARSACCPTPPPSPTTFQRRWPPSSTPSRHRRRTGRTHQPRHRVATAGPGGRPWHRGGFRRYLPARIPAVPARPAGAGDVTPKQRRCEEFGAQRGTGARPQAPPPRGGNGLRTARRFWPTTFVGLGEDSALQQHLDLQAGRLGLRMRTRIRLRSFEAVCRMVEAGVGVAVVPAIAAERYAGAGKLRI